MPRINKAKNLEWGSANRPKISNKLGIPHPSEGGDGDMQVRQTSAGPKLFAKLGGAWNSMFLSKESDVLSIRDNRGVERISLSSSGDADFHGTLKITGFGGMIDFRGGRDNIILGNANEKPLENLVDDSNNVRNIAFGNNAMNTTINGQDNIAIGDDAMRYMGRHASETYGDTQQNVAIGNSALEGYSSGTRTQGSFNVAMGYASMSDAHQLDGDTIATFSNVCIGTLAGKNVSSRYNVYLGSGTGLGNSGGSSGYENVAIGWAALEDISTGYNNVGIGTGALANCTQGFRNIAIGDNANTTVTTGDRNIIIGYNSDVSASGSNDQIVIGNSITCTADSTTVIGNTYIVLASGGGHVKFDGCGVGFDQEEETFSGDDILASGSGTGGTHDTHIDFRIGNKIYLQMTAAMDQMNLIFPAVSGNFLLHVWYNGDWAVGDWKVWESDLTAASNADVLWPGGTQPDNTSSGKDVFSFYWDAETQICYGVASLAFAAP